MTTETSATETEREAAVRRAENGRLAYYRSEADAEFWDERWTRLLDEETYRDADRGLLGYFEVPFTRYLPENGLILEAGCGMGQIVAALHARGYECEGVEWAEETVHAVQELRPDLPIRVGDVTELDVPDGYYRAYISLGVIEHRREGPEPFLTEARRVLADDGVALISVPYYHPLRRAKAMAGLYGGDVDGLSFYQYAFSRKEMKGLLRDAGFRVVDTYPYDGRKGLKDEMAWLRWTLDVDRIGWRLNTWLRHSSLSARFGHMMLYVARKREQVDAYLEQSG